MGLSSVCWRRDVIRQLLLSLAASAAAAAPLAPAGAAPPSVAGVYEAGRCMVAGDRRAAVALVRALPLDGQVADLSALRGSAADCAGPAQGASAMLVRGAIAQALFFRDFRVFGREPRTETGLIDLGLPTESSPGGTRSVELYRWADCVVRNDGAGTQRLLVSAVGSGEENAAIAGLQTYMSACMRGGPQLQVRASEVRSVFAQSAYHAMYRYWTGRLEDAGGRRN
jgi:hypothetical protein